MTTFPHEKSSYGLTSKLFNLSERHNLAARQEYTNEEFHFFLDWLRKNHAVYIEGDERPFQYYSQYLMFPEYEKNKKPSTNSYSGIAFSGDIYSGFPEAMSPKSFGEPAIELAL